MSKQYGYLTDSNGNELYTLNDTGWIDLSPYLTSNWSNYGSEYRTARFRKINNEVILEGTLRNNTSSNNRRILNLPVGYRPLQNMNIGIASGMMESGKVIKIVVYPDGRLELQDYDGTSWIALNNVRFYTN